MKTVHKQQWATETRRPGRGGSFWWRRFRVLVSVLLAVLTLFGLGYGLGAYLYSGTETSSASEEQAGVPIIEQVQQAHEPLTPKEEEPPPELRSPRPRHRPPTTRRST